MRAGAAPTIERISSSELPCGAARAALDFHSSGVRVILLEPSMPLAWAVDGRGANDVFHPTWHAERTLGVGAATLPTFADIAAPKSPIRVRAWGDDGTLFETSLSF
jgi:hypothetical protein